MPTVTKQSMKKLVKKIDSVWDRIAPISFGKDDGLKINIYGRSGTGKTTLWATFPKPILAIVCSGGTQPGELRSINTAEYRKTISQVAVRSSNEVSELAERQRGEERYNTVVLDHASGLQDLVLKEILGLDELPPQLSWGLASQQQYGQLAIKMKELLRSLLSLSCNVVIVAQEREFNTESSSDLLMPFVASALTPSVVGWLNPAVDYIVETFIRPKMLVKQVKVAGKTVSQTVRTKEVEYCARTAPHDVFTTKFRMPKGFKVPECIVDPDYDKILSLINQGS